MVVLRADDPDAGGPSPGDVLDYGEAMAWELSRLCEQAGAFRAAQKFREAAEALAGHGLERQLPAPNAAPGDAA